MEQPSPHSEVIDLTIEDDNDDDEQPDSTLSSLTFQAPLAPSMTTTSLGAYHIGSAYPHVMPPTAQAPPQPSVTATAFETCHNIGSGSQYSVHPNGMMQRGSTPAPNMTGGAPAPQNFMPYGACRPPVFLPLSGAPAVAAPRSDGSPAQYFQGNGFHQPHFQPFDRFGQAMPNGRLHPQGRPLQHIPAHVHQQPAYVTPGNFQYPQHAYDRTQFQQPYARTGVPNFRTPMSMPVMPAAPTQPFDPYGGYDVQRGKMVSTRRGNVSMNGVRNGVPTPCTSTSVPEMQSAPTESYDQSQVYGAWPDQAFSSSCRNDGRPRGQEIAQSGIRTGQHVPQPDSMTLSMNCTLQSYFEREGRQAIKTVPLPNQNGSTRVAMTQERPSPAVKTPSTPSEESATFIHDVFDVWLDGTEESYPENLQPSIGPDRTNNTGVDIHSVDLNFGHVSGNFDDESGNSNNKGMDFHTPSNSTDERQPGAVQTVPQMTATKRASTLDGEPSRAYKRRRPSASVNKDSAPVQDGCTNGKEASAMPLSTTVNGDIILARKDSAAAAPRAEQLATGR